MSDIGRYRQVYPRIWRHPNFTGLTKSARELTLYLLSGPQSNRIGCFFFSVATASEDLNVAVETIRKGLADISGAFGWTFDAKCKVFWIRSWWKWNQPANPNVLRGNLKDLSDIPPCAVTDAFARHVETLPETLHETFVEGCRQRLGKPSPKQEQYQDQYQDQEQYPALRAKAARKENSPPPPNTKLVTIAREALTYGDPNKSMDEMVDTFQCLAQHQGLTTKRPDVTVALNVAISERRMGA